MPAIRLALAATELQAVQSACVPAAADLYSCKAAWPLVANQAILLVVMFLCVVESLLPYPQVVSVWLLPTQHVLAPLVQFKCARHLLNVDQALSHCPLAVPAPQGRAIFKLKVVQAMLMVGGKSNLPPAMLVQRVGHCI
jgi:hypothetical protein